MGLQVSKSSLHLRHLQFECGQVEALQVPPKPPPQLSSCEFPSCRWTPGPPRPPSTRCRTPPSTTPSSWLPTASFIPEIALRLGPVTSLNSKDHEYGADCTLSKLTSKPMARASTIADGCMTVRSELSHNRGGQTMPMLVCHY